MNSGMKVGGSPPGDCLSSPHGNLLISSSGILSAVARDNTGAVRAAAAGDGFAADLADAVLRGDASSISVTHGGVVVVSSTGSAGVVQRGGVDAAHSGAGDRELAIAVDMTNWSIMVTRDDSEVIDVVKVVRNWGGADRAARQLTRIAERDASIIPPFLGRLDWVHPERGTATIALVSSHMPDANDGWTWAVDDVLAFVSGGAEPEWPARVGTLAAEMHRALLFSVDASAPKPTGMTLRGRAEAALREALRVTDGPAGVRLRNRAGALQAAIADIPDHSPAPVFDLHGDFHVGQLLRSPAASGEPAEHDYRVIDFDGDPQLEPEDRDRPDFSARDIAHMLASIDLVGAVAMRRLGSAVPLVLEWASRARDQLLTSYRDGLARTPPSGTPATSLAESPSGSPGTSLADSPSGSPGTSLADSFDERLLEGFIAEQLLRELIYADRYLQRWQYAPDAVISLRYPRTPGPEASPITEEEPWTPPAFTMT